MKFVDEVESRREELITLLTDASPKAPGITDAEARQMVAGYLHLVTAAANGDTKPRDEYLATVIPGVKQAGMKLGYIIRVLVALDLAFVSTISAEHRAWVSQYCADYADRLITAWEAA